MAPPSVAFSARDLTDPQMVLENALLIQVHCQILYLHLEPYFPQDIDTCGSMVSPHFSNLRKFNCAFLSLSSKHITHAKQ